VKIVPLRLPGTFEVTLEPYLDERGYFVRTYDDEMFRELGLQTNWVQENQSRTLDKHTIRGIHFQLTPHAETKLIRVVSGALLDVFVDIRRRSDTYGQWDALELTADNFKAAYVPKGFAHGFCTLADDTIAIYKVDAYYAPGHERGVRWNDPTLNIDWPTDAPDLSSKDATQPLFRELESQF
jgi:dTDP-4-dehydrorhamnose 3,5-epimerase